MQARTETVHDNKANRRVITFLKHPAVAIEPQGDRILKTIETSSPVLRGKLVADLAPHIISKRRISDVVSFYLGYLKRMGCVKVEEFEEWQSRQGEPKLAQSNHEPKQANTKAAG